MNIIKNVAKITEEIKAAGIPVHGIASTGRIDFKDDATDEQKQQAADIMAAFDDSAATVAVDAIAKLREMDANLPRRLEDVCRLFISKNILTEQDFEAASPGLPKAIADREALRKKLKPGDPA